MDPAAVHYYTMHYPQNLIDILIENKNKRPSKPALYVKKSGHYVPITYQNFFNQSVALAQAFHKMGLKKGDTIGLLSNNRPEWAISDFGILLTQAVNVPIYTTLSAQEIAYILQNATVTTLLIDTLAQYEKLRPILASTPVRYIILFETQTTNTTPSTANTLTITPIDSISAQTPNKASSHYCLSFSDLLKPDPKSDSNSNNVPLPTPNPNDICSIVYTSGTTGNPKGVQLSHKNFASNVRNICQALPLKETEKVLSFLPLSHVFERTAGYYVVLAIGGSIYYAQSIDTVSEDLIDAQPTVLISVPRLFEKVMAKIQHQLSPFKRLLFKCAQSIADTYYTHPTRLTKGLFALANQVVFKKIKAKLGGNIRFMVSGGAPLNPVVAKFFHTLDILIIEGYGLTESSPVIACNRFEKIKYGSVGKVLPNQEVKLAEDGELLTRGDHVMSGYLNMPEKTAEVLDSDGWLHTGDIAKIDEDDYIFIVDRKKDLIVLSNGKKVAPQLVESDLILSPYITQAVVIGEKRNYITALIVPNLAAIPSEINETLHLDSTHANQDAAYQKLNENPALQQLIQTEIEKRLAHYAPFEQVKKFKLLPNEFTIESGELTPSMKPKRPVIRTKFKDVIDSLYEETSANNHSSSRKTNHKVNHETNTETDTKATNIKKTDTKTNHTTKGD